MAPVKTTLTNAERESMCDFIAKRWLENASLKDLERFFVDTSREILESMDDSELIGTLEDNATDEEFQEFTWKAVRV